MMAIRSRVEALACSERNHSSSDCCRGFRRSAAVHGSATGTRRLTRSNRHWIRETSTSSMHRQPRNGAAIRRGPGRATGSGSCRGCRSAPSRSPARRASSMTASCVGPTNVPPRSTGRACDRRGRRPAADPVAALQHDDVVAEPDQFARCGQPREPGPDDDDVGVGVCSSRERSSPARLCHATRLSRREGDDSAVRAHQCDRAGAGLPRRRCERGLHLRGDRTTCSRRSPWRRPSAAWT